MIECRGVSLRQGAFSLDALDLAVPSGAYAVLMGATGSGKTSLLEAILGLRRIGAGSIAVEGREVTREPPGARGIGYVPQDGALFATLTVREHLAFAPRLRGWPIGDIHARVAELADQLGIAALVDRRPEHLSGGERQRVALARALSFRPGVLCLDEPLSALDEATQERMHALLERIHREARLTILHVTHSRREAERLATVRFRLADGRISEEP